MAKYKVSGEKVEMTGKKGKFTWDKGSEVTELQVSEKEAGKLIKSGKLKVIK